MLSRIVLLVLPYALVVESTDVYKVAGTNFADGIYRPKSNVILTDKGPPSVFENYVEDVPWRIRQEYAGSYRKGFSGSSHCFESHWYIERADPSGEGLLRYKKVF